MIKQWINQKIKILTIRSQASKEFTNKVTFKLTSWLIIKYISYSQRIRNIIIIKNLKNKFNEVISKQVNQHEKR